MSENVNPPEKNVQENDQSPEAISQISLSQAILAPLDALFMAQVHAARSFLSLLLQIGYPHIPLDNDNLANPKEIENKGVYTQDFYCDSVDGKQLKVSIPGLALIPLTPLTIDNASFKLNFKVESIQRHQQMQKSEHERIKKDARSGIDSYNRPWYLVQNPVDFSGHIAASKGGPSETTDDISKVINIEINLIRQPLPAGLDKLLTALQQSSYVKENTIY